MKKIIIIAISGGLIIISVYFYGKTTGYKKCQIETAKQTSIKQNEIVKTMERINAETFNTGVSDIRQRLRENWTIHD